MDSLQNQTTLKSWSVVSDDFILKYEPCNPHLHPPFVGAVILNKMHSITIVGTVAPRPGTIASAVNKPCPWTLDFVGFVGKP